MLGTNIMIYLHVSCTRANQGGVRVGHVTYAMIFCVVIDIMTIFLRVFYRNVIMIYLVD